MAEKQANKKSSKADTATLTVAAVLQEFARHGFDLPDRSQEELQESCDGWIAHLLKGEKSPGRADLQAGWLDWPGVRDFVIHERTRESDFVSEHLEGAHSISDDAATAMDVTQETNGALRSQLEALRQLAAGNSSDAATAEVLKAIQQLGSTIDHSEQSLMDLLAQIALAGGSIVSTEDLDVETREELDANLLETVGRIAAGASAFTLVLGRIDGFDSLVELQGTETSNEILTAVAKSFRNVFAEKGDFVARYDDTSFAVVTSLPAVPTRLRAERVLASVRSLGIKNEGKPVAASISIGLAAARPELTPNAWCTLAEEAAQESFEAGRNRLTIADPR